MIHVLNLRVCPLNKMTEPEVKRKCHRRDIMLLLPSAFVVISVITTVSTSVTNGSIVVAIGVVVII